MKSKLFTPVRICNYVCVILLVAVIVCQMFFPMWTGEDFENSYTKGTKIQIGDDPTILDVEEVKGNNLVCLFKTEKPEGFEGKTMDVEIDGKAVTADVVEYMTCTFNIKKPEGFTDQTLKVIVDGKEVTAVVEADKNNADYLVCAFDMEKTEGFSEKTVDVTWERTVAAVVTADKGDTLTCAFDVEKPEGFDQETIEVMIGDVPVTATVKASENDAADMTCTFDTEKPEGFDPVVEENAVAEGDEAKETEEPKTINAKVSTVIAADVADKESDVVVFRVEIEKPNGFKEKAAFTEGTGFKINKAVSLGSLVWNPRDHKEFIKEIGLGAKGQEFPINMFVICPVAQLLLGVVGIIFCAVKSKNGFVAIVPAIVGIIGLIGKFVLCQPYLSLEWANSGLVTAMIVIDVITIVVSIVAIVFAVIKKNKKKKEAELYRASLK